MAIDESLYLGGKVGIDGCGGLFGEGGQDLRKLAPLRFGWAQHCKRMVISFDDHLGALPHLFQHGVQVAGQFGFADMDLRHILIIPSRDLEIRILRDRGAVFAGVG